MHPKFINFSNHPSQGWEADQLDAAQEYGTVVDIPFPSVSAWASTADVNRLAGKVCEEIEKYRPAAVMVQGEFTLTYHVIRMLKEKQITVLAGCAERETREEKCSDGSVQKIARFKFVQFREY